MKKYNKGRLFVLVGLFMLLFTIFTSTQTFNLSNYNENDNINRNIELEDLFISAPRGEIKIYNDSAFIEANGVSNATGTKGDPYVISNWDINSPVSGINIEIVNTTSYFEIRGCSFSNGIVGIMLQNVTNGKVFNNTFQGFNSTGVGVINSKNINITDNVISNVYGANGFNGANGMDGDPPDMGDFGTDGGQVTGIYSNNSSLISISYNNISDICGGQGGNGGNGGDHLPDVGMWMGTGGEGGVGGDGGSGMGIIVENSNNSVLFKNNIQNLYGGNGGTGGLGGDGSDMLNIDDNGGDGNMGGMGGSGGKVISIFVDASYNVSTYYNNISNLYGGSGGNAKTSGNGGDGRGDSVMGGFGGVGNWGGNGGIASGMSFENVQMSRNGWNNLWNVYGGNGGDGGDGGAGGNVTDDTDVWAGMGGGWGVGGTGGNTSGLSFTNCQDFNNSLNFINNIEGGKGGNGGDGGKAGICNAKSLEANAGGDGGSGDVGGAGGTSFGIYYESSNNCINENNRISFILGGSGGEGGTGKDGTDAVGSGWGMGGGSGGSAGDGGDGGSSVGIFAQSSININSTFNEIVNITGGNGNLPGLAGSGGSAINDNGGWPGWGGSGGSGGIAAGFQFSDCQNINNQWNDVLNIVAGDGTSGSDGGDGGNGGGVGDGEDGGNGGNGGTGASSYGVYITQTNFTFHNDNSLVNITCGKGGDGGDGGDGGNTGGDGGDAGDGGNSNNATVMYYSASNNITNIFNIISNASTGYGGTGGSGGIPGTGGTAGAQGTRGQNSTAFGFYYVNSESSESWQNEIYILNNTDIGGNYNNWNASIIGNYWDYYTGSDLNDDNIGDIPYQSAGIIDYLPIWDDTPPKMMINLPINNTTWSAAPMMNVSANDLNLDSIWYNVTGIPIIEFLINNTDEALNDTIWALLPDGQFSISFYANDSLGYVNDTYTYTFYKDTTAPNLVVNLPQNQTAWDITPTINVTAYGPDLALIWYNVQGNSTIFPIVNNTNIVLDSFIWNNLPQGEFQITLNANDTLGNVNTYSLTLYKDNYIPNITINLPYNGTWWGSPPLINVSVYDVTLNSIWYNVTGNPIKYFIVNNSAQLLDAGAWVILPEGVFTINFYANDSLGRLSNNFDLTLFKDTIYPSVILNSPLNNTVLDLAPMINITASDINLGSIWYRVGATNEILSNNIEEALLPAIWSSLPEGSFLLYIFANDTTGNVNNSIILTLTKDTIAPQITIVNPMNLSYSNFAPWIHLIVNDATLDSIWYNITGDPTSYFLLNDTADQLNNAAWNGLPQGWFSINFYANDSTGKINDTFSIQIYKDTINPLVSVSSLPANNSYIYVDVAPQVNISVFDINNNSIWYTITGNSTKQFLLNNTLSSIDQYIWNNLGQGMFQILIFADDAAGNLNDSLVLTFYKDTLAPQITIITPQANEEFGGTAPSFNLSIIEVSLDTTWYTIDGGLNNTAFIGLNGTILQVLWDAIPDLQEITINFYANDSQGRIGNVSVVVKKNLSIDGNPAEQFDLIGFLTSPVGLTVIGVSVGAIIIISAIKIKGRSHRGGGKEKEKIEELLRDTWWKSRD